MAKVIIIGGHGKIALQAASLLAARGDQVTSIIRNPQHQDDVAATGATALVLDLEKASPQELANAFNGADAIVWSAGAGGKGGTERTYAVDQDAAIAAMDAAAAAGVTRFLMVSWSGSYDPLAVPTDHPLYHYAVAKLAADHHLVSTDLKWTILGPSTLTDEEPSGAITVGRLEPGSAKNTARGNVARAIAEAVHQPATIHRVIPFVDGDTPIAAALTDVPAELAEI